MATDPAHEGGMLDDDAPMGTDPTTGERVDRTDPGGSSNLDTSAEAQREDEPADSA